MRIYIFTDLEGATAVTDYDYGDLSRRRKDRKFLTRDVNAAVEGAYDAGAEAVVVCDGHGKDAVLLDELDPRATLVRKSESETYLPGLNGSFNHFVLIGFHSMAGAGGLLSHTHSLRVRRIVLNGEEIGEIGLSFIYAQCYGVRPAFVSGDDKAIGEARQYMPKVGTVAVKRSISEKSGECLSPAVTYSLIRDGVRRSLSNHKENYLNLPSPPYEMKVIYKKPWVAIPRYLLKRKFNGVRIKDLYTISYKDKDFVELLKKFLCSRYLDSVCYNNL